MERKCISVILRIVLLYTIIFSAHCEDCGRPPNIPHSRLKNEFQGQRIFPPGSQVKYECDTGYTPIPGMKNYVICMSDLRWSLSEEFCTLRRCPHPGDVEHGSIVKIEPLVFGSKVIYACDEGYRMQSKKNYRVCQADGTWSNTRPVCEVVVCPPPPTIPGGSFSPWKDEYEYRDSVTYKCKNRNAVMEHDSLFCTENGNWSNTEPRCIGEDCGRPPNIPHSKLKNEFQGQTIFPPGTQVKYECDTGYTPIPGMKNYVICMSDLRWSLSEEFCTLRRCPHPGDIEHGSIVKIEPLVFGSKVIYACDEGYRMQSKKNYRVCQADGTWSNTRPVCEVVVCPPPPTISGGSFSPLKDEYEYRDSVTYKCKDRNAVMEYDSLFCTENGNWSNTEPRCIVVDCPPPNVPNSKRHSGFSGPYGLDAVVEFECNKGFTMNGSDTIRCTIQSTWHPPPPKCIKLYCPEPKLENGTIISGEKPDGSYDVKDSITLGCDQGFRLRGQKNLTCGEDFQWKPEMPYCELGSYCPEPSLENGMVESGLKPDGSYDFGDSITLKCNPGYKLIGSKKLTCGGSNSDLQWQGEFPVCEKRSYCPEPSLENGMVESGWKPDGSYESGDSITLKCNPGYKLIGLKKLTCGGSDSDLQWQGEFPVCEKRSYCPEPSLENGMVESGLKPDGSYESGDSITLKCNPGYKLIGSKKLTCGGSNSDLQWQGEYPVCEKRPGTYCPEPSLENGMVESGWKPDGSYESGDSITLKCYPGYKLIGSKKLTCGGSDSDLQWQGEFPVCEKRSGSYCPEPSLENGMVASGFKPDGSYDTGDSIILRCNPGYTLNGNEILTCSECNGHLQWQGEFPVCEKGSYCPEPLLENGMVISGCKTDGSYESGDYITLRCNPGYKLNGKEKLICGESNGNLQWQGEFPVCEKELYCSIPHILNGKISEGKKPDGSYSIGSKVRVKCKSGYELNNNGKLTCGDDLKWRPKFTICELKNGCKFPLIQNGRVTEKNDEAYNPEEDGYGFSVYDEISIACDEGYQLNGMHLAICLKSFGSRYEWVPEIRGCERKLS
ncbi:complement receptor type 2-like [Hyperolius riggenbachi]|uniref:complement receptor type 2-like n=1 Tax=Hyperolius riggenbachi TaxID=752182 RepID=UPI0035A3C0B0